MSPWSVPPHQPSPRPTAGEAEAPGGGWAARAHRRGGGEPPPADGAGVAPSGPDSGVMGVRPSPMLAPTHLPGAGGVSPSPGVRVRCGRGALRPVPEEGWRVLACVGVVVCGRRSRSATRSVRCSRSAWDPPGGRTLPGGRAGQGAPPSRGSPGVVAVSATVSQGPPGGARVGGGGRSPRRQGSRVGPQQPNKGLQATPNSLRSCFAPALGRA